MFRFSYLDADGVGEISFKDITTNVDLKRLSTIADDSDDDN
jgi:hypothetical protein